MAAEVIDLISSSGDERSPRKAARTALASLQPRTDKHHVNGNGPKSGTPKPLMPFRKDVPSRVQDQTPREYASHGQHGHSHSHSKEAYASGSEGSLTSLLQQDHEKQDHRSNEAASVPSRTSSASRANLAKRTSGAEQEERKRKFKMFHMKELGRKQPVADRNRNSPGHQTTQGLNGNLTAKEPLPKRRASPLQEEGRKAIKRMKEGNANDDTLQQGLDQARRLSAAAVDGALANLDVHSEEDESNGAALQPGLVQARLLSAAAIEAASRNHNVQDFGNANQGRNSDNVPRSTSVVKLRVPRTVATTPRLSPETGHTRRVASSSPDSIPAILRVKGRRPEAKADSSSPDFIPPTVRPPLRQPPIAKPTKSLSASIPPTTAPPKSLPAASGSGNFGSRYSAEEDDLLVLLREEHHIKWQDMPNYFEGRTQGSLQVRYSTLKSRRSTAISASRRSEQHPKGAAQTPETALPAKRQHKTVRPDGFVSWADIKAKRLDERQAVAAGKAVQTQKSIQEVAMEASDALRPSSLARVLRGRELGRCPGRAWSTPWRKPPDEMQNHIFDTLGPRRSFHGMSRDVNCIAWARDGNRFAAGAIAISDPASMQYNRPNNLLLGDVNANSVCELPEHHVKRPVVDDPRNVNALHEMRETQDPRLFKTVAAVSFSSNGERLFSGGGDHKVRMYDVNNLQCLHTQDLGATVDLLAVNSNDLVAAASHRSDQGGISVFKWSGSRFSARIDFGAAKPGTGEALYPTAVKWGSGRHSNLLLGGFACDAIDDDNTTAGEIGLWDVETGAPIHFGYSTRTVFDVAWNPSPSSASSNFAVASARAGRRIRSLVQCFAFNQVRAKRVLEWECPALDINDVVYCPHDDNLIAAGATDGNVYVWDKRHAGHHQRPLHVLSHDTTKNVLDHDRDLEVADTGVRFLSWSATGNRLYSGSSDGTVKIWNPYRPTDEALVRNVATYNSAIMSGACSPDYRGLLIGEEQGQLNLLSVDREGRSIRATKNFDLHPAPAPTTHTMSEDKFSAARQMLQSGEIQLEQMGALKIRQAVQGPRYRGSYAAPTDSEMDDLQNQRRAALVSKQNARTLAAATMAIDSDNDDDPLAKAQLEVKRAGEDVARLDGLLAKAVEQQRDAAVLKQAAAQLQKDFYNARNTQRRLDDSEYQSIERCQLDCNYLPAAGDDDGEAPDDLLSEQRVPDALRSAALPLIDVSDLTNAELLDMELTSKCGACMGPAARSGRGILLCTKCGLMRSGLTAHCNRCFTPVRPNSVEKAANLCQRCDFTCFRCGRSADVADDRSSVACMNCQKSWEAGVLGYELLDGGKAGVHVQRIDDDHDDVEGGFGIDEMERLASRWLVPLLDGLASLQLN